MDQSVTCGFVSLAEVTLCELIPFEPWAAMPQPCEKGHPCHQGRHGSSTIWLSKSANQVSRVLLVFSHGSIRLVSIGVLLR